MVQSRFLQREHSPQWTTCWFFKRFSETTYQRGCERPFALIVNAQPLAHPCFLCLHLLIITKWLDELSRFRQTCHKWGIFRFHTLLCFPCVIFHHEHHVDHVRLQKFFRWLKDLNLSYYMTPLVGFFSNKNDSQNSTFFSVWLKELHFHWTLR